MTDTWLRDHLIRQGCMTERGVTRRARTRICRRCNTDVLAGLDDYVAAIEVAVDPVPLSPLGEALALAKGHRTFGLHKEGGAWVLDRRDGDHITHHPAGTRDREDVVPSHVCGSTWAGPLTTASRFPETKPPTPTGSTPPF